MPMNPNVPPRQGGLDTGVVATVAAVFLAFTSVSVLLLQPVRFADRLIAMGIGVGLSVLTLVVGVRASRLRRDPSDVTGAGRSDAAVAEQLQQQAWVLQEVSRNNRQLGQEIRSIRTRLEPPARPAAASTPPPRPPAERMARRSGG